MKRSATKIDNTEKFWIKLVNHNPKLADKKMKESKKVNHKYLQS